MDMEFWENKAEIAKRKKQKAQKYNKSSKQKLEATLSKYLQTVMIGALDDFERNFGKLWGHGLPVEKLTDAQKQGREIWEKARTSILDRGNLKIKHMKSELSRYTVHWNRYITKFKIKDQE